jgi:dTDP-4-amino-4,6-dideoxygalactose transaminase
MAKVLGHIHGEQARAHHQRAVADRERNGAPRNTGQQIVDEILTLPISAGHTEAEVDQVVAAVREFFGA